MITLGIHDGHLSGAAIIIDGVIAAAINEERLTRTKNAGGMPTQSIQWLLHYLDLQPKDVDQVAVGGIAPPYQSFDQDTISFRRKAYLSASNFLPASVIGSKALIKPYQVLTRKPRERAASKIIQKMGFNKAQIEFVDHHFAHASAAYYLAPSDLKASGPMLIFVSDGSGDGIATSIYIGDKGHLERIFVSSAYHSLGELYARTTQLLGMRPLEDEYKVMGMAAYASSKMSKPVVDSLSKRFHLTRDGLEFQSEMKSWGPGLVPKLKTAIGGYRFDAIAGGIQTVTENLIAQWIKNWILRTNIHSIACAGGLFMNVKANMLLTNLPEIKRIFIMPSCGDESNSIGSALYAIAKGHTSTSTQIASLDTLYFGPEPSYNVEADLARSYVKYCVKSEARWQPWAGLKCSAA